MYTPVSYTHLFCIESADSNPGKHGRDTNQEFILYSVFDKDANAGAIELNKNILPYIYPTRKFIDMFVCTNGLPIAGNEQFKGYHNMGDEFQNRDYRMNSYVGAPTTAVSYTHLLVEDNKEFRTFLKEQLEDFYQIVEAADGEEGERCAIDENPDLIISDIMMPKVDGIEPVSYTHFVGTVSEWGNAPCMSFI